MHPVLFRPSVPPMKHFHVPSISSQCTRTHTHFPSPCGVTTSRNIRNITDWSLFLFNASAPRAGLENRRGCTFESRVYRFLFARYAIFFFVSISLFSPVCTRLSKPRFRLGKRTPRYVSNYEPRAAFGYIDLWPLTRDEFFFFFLGSFYVFFIIITSFSRDFPAISSPSLDSESWKWKGVVHLFEINSVKFIFFKRKRDFIRNGIMNVSYL